jgi:uncharacterized repeat protein (TIGR01451 family)
MNKLHFFKSIKAYSEKKIVLQTLVLMQLLLVSTVTNAIAPNPGATCPDNYTQGTLTNADYNTLMSSYTNNSYVSVTGSNGIPLQINMSATDSNTNTVTQNFAVNSTQASNAINITKDFPLWSDNTQITLSFRNSKTQQPLYLTNVALSAFDIDFANYTRNYFDDAVKISGTTASGTTIRGVLQPITGSNIVDNITYGLRTTSSANCPAKDLGTACQGSIQFSEAVSSVTITYSNSDRTSATNTTLQEIDFKVDSYCYPSSAYTITKDDNTTSIATGANTTYTIKVTNTGGTNLTDLVLTDPAVTGLTKLSNITCATGDTTNICSSTSLPTIAQLEGSGYPIGSLAVGRSYSINVPVNVTAAAGSTVTNTATISGGGLTSQSAADTDSVTSVFASGGTPTPATCPAGDRMYFIGNNPPTSAYEKQTLSNWTAGNTSKTYTFTDGAQATIKFENIKDVTNFGGTTTPTPTYTTSSALGVGSIAIFHNSTGAVTNHSISLLVNKPVSRAGYVINDLDSHNPGSGTAYQEQFDVSGSNGLLSLVNSNAQTINASNNIITSRTNINCSDNNGSAACPDNAVWGYSAANTAFKGNHNNITSIASTNAHAVGYNDFFFCLSPPKLINQKILNGTRAQPSDQFTIATTGGTVNNSFTTAGTGSTIDAGTNQSSVIALTSGTSATYTITESITNSGSLTNYNTTYKCTNGTTSTSTMPSGNGSSFSLSNLNYGDEITCQITNAPKAYTFSGIVFNDNGGLTLANDLSVPVSTNTTYFNGVYDSSVEKGITQTGLTIDLAKNCNATTPTIIQSATVGSDGTYSISATSTQMANATNVCLIQREPNGNLTSYPVDTTNNQANITFASTTYDYQNINFGEVSQNNAGLVLVKEQAVNDCNISIATMLGLNYVSTQQDAIDARKCVAYKITAHNRTNLTNGLTDVKITDALPKKGVNGSTVNSLLDNPLDTTLTNFKVDTANSVAIGANGTVVSDVQSLAKGASRSLYFNTKYDANSK